MRNNFAFIYHRYKSKEKEKKFKKDKSFKNNIRSRDFYSKLICIKYKEPVEELSNPMIEK